MKAFWLCFSMLCIIPIPFSWYDGVKKPAQIAYFFPFVGLILALASAGVTYVLQPLLPPWPLAIFLTLLWAGISGAFHLDGLADCADAFLSSRTRERMKEIMKDSHIGAMGVLALIFQILIKVACLQEFASDRKSLTLAIFSAVLLGRCSLSLSMVFSPCVSQGLARNLWLRHKSVFVIAIAFSAVLFLLYPWQRAALLALSTVAFGAFWSFYCRRKIGGGTGDTLGASCEIAEALTLLCLLAL